MTLSGPDTPPSDGAAHTSPGGAPYGRSLLSQGISRVLFMGCSFAVFVLIARSTDAGVVGRYSLGLAVISIAIAAADFGTTTVTGAELARRARAERPVFFGALLAVRLAAGTVTAMGLAVTALFLQAEIAWAVGLAAAVCPLVAARFYDPVFQVFGRPGWTPWLSLVYGASLLPMSGAVLRLPQPDGWLVAVVVIAGALYGLAGLAMSMRLLRPSFAHVGREAVVLLRRAAPIGIASLTSMLNARVGVIALSLLATPAAAGAYGAAFRFFDLGGAVAVTIATPLIPIFVAEAAADQARLRRALARSLEMSFAMTLPLAAAAPAVSPALVRVLFGADFAETAPTIDLMAWMFALMQAAMILFAALVAEQRQGVALPIALAALIANVCICLALIPRWGIGGAALGAFVAELLTFCANLALVLRTDGLPIDLRRMGLVAGWTLVIAAVAGLCPPSLAMPLALTLLALHALSAVRLKLVPVSCLPSRRPHDV